MRFRRKAWRGRRPKIKRGTDWIWAVQLRCGERITVEDCIAQELGPTYFSLLTLDDVIDHDDNLTLERLVGELWFSSYGAITGPQVGDRSVHVVHWGLYTSVIEAPNTLSETFTQLDPSTSQDAEAPWAFRRQWGHTFHSEASFESSQYSPDARIDLHVKRKLRSNEELLLAVSATFDNQGSTPAAVVRDVHMYGQVRALVKLS